MRNALAVLLVGLLSLSCEGPVSGGDGWVRASLRGVVEAEYEGTGEFHVDRHPGLDAVFFQMVSEGNGSAGEQSFNVLSFGDIPDVGRYPIREAAKVDGDRTGFSATYHRRSDGWSESYASVSGELEITHSSTDRLEGRFRLNTVRYCRSLLVSGPGDPLPEGSCTPMRLDLSAPSLELTGSFVAVRVQLKKGTRM